MQVGNALQKSQPLLTYLTLEGLPLNDKGPSCRQLPSASLLISGPAILAAIDKRHLLCFQMSHIDPHQPQLTKHEKKCIVAGVELI